MKYTSFGIALLSSLIIPLAVRAEGLFHNTPGTRAIGANRRVLTSFPPSAGYYGVEGTFDMPMIKVPHQGNQVTTDRTNWFGSKPTFYLGCRQEEGTSAEVDAGLQWEDAITYTDNAGNIQTYPNSQGWAILLRYTNCPLAPAGSSFVNPVDSSGRPYRVPAGVSKIKFRWVVPSDGSVTGYPGYLDVLALDSSGQPVASQPVGDPTPANFDYVQGAGRIWASSPRGTAPASLFVHRGGMRVKRVVGITQDDTHPADGQNHLTFPSATDVGGADIATNVYEEDGSYMRGCRFSGGRVAVQAATSGITWIPWSQAYMEQDPIPGADRVDYEVGTGWFPGGLDKSIRTPANTPGGGLRTIGHARLSRNIIDFPELQAAGIPRASESHVQRYDEELVEINLQRHRFSSGVIIRPGINNH
jgi:hypothetical protein